jgi:hypothetical protein
MLREERNRATRKAGQINSFEAEITRAELTPRELRKMWDETDLAAWEGVDFQGYGGPTGNHHPGTHQMDVG